MSSCSYHGRIASSLQAYTCTCTIHTYICTQVKLNDKKCIFTNPPHNLKAFPKATSQAPMDGEPFSNANVVVSKLQIPKHKSYQTRCEHIVQDCFLPNKGGMESKFTEKVRAVLRLNDATTERRHH